MVTFLPKTLRAYFGERVEVWRSLRTVDHDEALYNRIPPLPWQFTHNLIIGFGPLLGVRS
ncbi:MAG: hypothetical protein OJF51_002884 [Nitrospira sp.]|jgi:hypothetical protein|nr:MAG: hypothetical protein OJF51_002884 [Nitrospira sp.]